MDQKKIDQPQLFDEQDLDDHFAPHSGKTTCPIEIDEDGVPSQYQDGLWEDAFINLTAKCVKVFSFAKSGDIYRWSAPSCNFGHPGISTFYIVVGLPASFRQYLGAQLEAMLKKSVRAYSYEIKPKASDGWSKAIHIENGNVWSQYDGEHWTLTALD